MKVVRLSKVIPRNDMSFELFKEIVRDNQQLNEYALVGDLMRVREAVQ